MFDDDLPAKPKAVLKNLAPMSLDELEGYIADMEKEIGRTREEIARKKAHQDAASSFFKKTGA